MGHGSHPTAWELMDLILLIVAKFDINQGEYFNASLVPTSGTKLTTASKQNNFGKIFSYLSSLSLSELLLMFHFRPKIFNYFSYLYQFWEMLNNLGGNC